MTLFRIPSEILVQEVLWMFKRILKWTKRGSVSSSHLKYRPTFFLRHHLLQSAYELISPRIDMQYARDKVYFMDGGHISLDWSDKEAAELGAPIVIIMHGMTGGSETKYIQVLVKAAQQLGYCSVCINSRGINSEMTSPIPFIGFDFHELTSALKRITALYPNNRLYFIGTSLGSNYLLRYLIRQQAPAYISKLKGMALISPPFDVNYVVDEMNAHYQRFFIKSYLKHTILRHQPMKFWWESGIVDLDSLKASKNLREFHNRITVKLMGLQDSREFFDHFKINREDIQRLNIPTMILAAKDDPMVGFPSFPIAELQKNPLIELNFTQKGGHLCWFEGFPPRRWYPTPVFEFLNRIEKSSSNNNNHKQQ